MLLFTGFSWFVVNSLLLFFFTVEKLEIGCFYSILHIFYLYISVELNFISFRTYAHY